MDRLTNDRLKTSRLHEHGGTRAKLEVGEHYIQVWAPDNGRVLFPRIITI